MVTPGLPPHKASRAVRAAHPRSNTRRTVFFSRSVCSSALVLRSFSWNMSTTSCARSFPCAMPSFFAASTWALRGGDGGNGGSDDSDNDNVRR